MFYPAGLQWDAEPYPARPLPRHGLSMARILVLCLFLPLTGSAIYAAWLLLWPATSVQTRIVAEPPGPAGRAALADAALRVSATGNRSVTLDDHGEALVITVSDPDPETARLAARSAANVLLNLAQPSVSASIGLASPGAATQNQDGRATLLADRNRLQSALVAADARLSTLSASLTGIVRDLASSTRTIADRKPNQDTLEKAETALADLQLQRIQLQSRYQDDYPAIVVLDGQIRSLRSFMQNEEHRVGAASSHTANPADIGLGAERDRLRAELTQVGDGRAVIASELAGVTRALAQAPAPRSPPPPADLAGARSTPPMPVLVEGATIIASGPDVRWLVVGGIAVFGLVLSLLAWFKPVRRHQSMPADLLLQRLETLLLPHGSAAALSETGPYSKLSRADGDLQLRPSPNR